MNHSIFTFIKINLLIYILLWINTDDLLTIFSYFLTWNSIFKLLQNNLLVVIIEHNIVSWITTSWHKISIEYPIVNFQPNVGNIHLTHWQYSFRYIVVICNILCQVLADWTYSLPLTLVTMYLIVHKLQS